MNPESIFKGKVLKQLREIPGSWFFKSNERSLKGIPDIIGHVNGRFVAIELKATNRPAEPLQEKILFDIQESGAIAFVAWPGNWPQVLARITALNGSRFD
jgi:hypothetical protein